MRGGFIDAPQGTAFFVLTRDTQNVTISNARCAWGRSSAGRALPSQGRGRGFESPRLHQDCSGPDALASGPFSCRGAVPGVCAAEKTSPLYQFSKLTPRNARLCTAHQDRAPRKLAFCISGGRSTGGWSVQQQAFLGTDGTATGFSRHFAGQRGTAARFSRHPAGQRGTVAGFSRHSAPKLVQTFGFLDTPLETGTDPGFSRHRDRRAARP